MPNTNCLEGIRCPECGHEDGFYVRVECTVRLIDNGIEECSNHGGYEWDRNTACECEACGRSNIMEAFYIDNQPEKETPCTTNQK